MKTLYAISILAALAVILADRSAAADAGWGFYGGDQGGQRYSAASQITLANVRRMKLAWTYSTSDLANLPTTLRNASFEDTPILGDGRLYICSPFDAVSALNPGTGKLIWKYDPRLDRSLTYANKFVCRGVAFWRDPRSRSELCASRIFLATADRRLIALDAATGRQCPSFGNRGVIKLVPDSALSKREEEQNTSPPLVSRGIVIVGSSIEDNWRVDAPKGTVRAFDAVTGIPRWSFEPVPRNPAEFQKLGWDRKSYARTGAANVWAPLSADDERGLVFLPTTSPSPDFYGGFRKGNDRNADSVVAVHTDTGKLAWAFQVTHHDVWDYDVSSQPTLAVVDYRGTPTPALLQPTKQGLLFTLNRVTGVPLIPVIERAVPQGGVAGERLSPTQPFPVAPPPLTPTVVKQDDAFGLTPWDRGVCRDAIAKLRNQGIYTPPSAGRGSLQLPGYSGGVNWGGLAFDPGRQIAIVNTTNIADVIRLFPAGELDKVRSQNPGKIVSPQKGSPYGITSTWLLGPLGMPCNPPPWGRLTAIDMRDGRVIWSSPLGTTADIFPFSDLVLGKTGTPNLGGPIITAGGLVFVAAAMDDYLRAFDVRTGVELWRGRLPAGGQSTPITYMWNGRQYVVIAAGGHAGLNTKRGDTIVAFRLPD